MHEASSWLFPRRPATSHSRIALLLTRAIGHLAGLHGFSDFIEQDEAHQLVASAPAEFQPAEWAKASWPAKQTELLLRSGKLAHALDRK